MILENAVGSRKSAQAIDSSVCRITSYMKKVLITNKVTTHFFITLSKSLACTSFSRPTAFSRMIQNRLRIGLLLGCLLLALSACGNKGPLVQAEDEEQQKTETGTE
jgi:predicted small lipoprotein YifL